MEAILMSSKVKQKLGILVVLGLLLLAIAVPVMAATNNNGTAPGKFGLGNGSGTCTGLTDEQREQMQANRDARLKAMVENGRITQADYDARVALQEKMEQYRDKLTDLSASERQTKMKEYRAQALKELLSAGTITQTQYDQLSAAGPCGRLGNGSGGKGPGMGGHRMGANGACGSGQCGQNCIN